MMVINGKVKNDGVRTLKKEHISQSMAWWCWTNFGESLKEQHLQYYNRWKDGLCIDVDAKPVKHN